MLPQIQSSLLVELTPDEYLLEVNTRLDEITTDDFLKQAFLELLAFSINVKDLVKETSECP